jgi:large subunit ribosomal protein L16
VLYPKCTRFRKYQKGRSKGCKVDGTQLCFGKFGMTSCKVGRNSYQAIEATRRIISKEFRRNGQIWVKIFIDIPIINKRIEVRMGKGKGNSTCWITCVVEGQILFEMNGVSLSNAQKVVALATHKLCLSTKFV